MKGSGFHTRFSQYSRVNPRITDQDVAAESSYQRQKRAAKIAEAHKADYFSRKQERILVITRPVQSFIPGTDRGIRLVNTTRARNRHSHRHFRYRLRKNR